MTDSLTSVSASASSILTPTQEITTYTTFDEMGLPDNLLRGIYSYGFERPSVIQQKAIKPIAEGRDILAQAQSGTGKTGTFCIGSMCRVDPALKAPQILVLTPTRELAQQIEVVAKGLSDKIPLSVYCAVGGTELHHDLRALDRGAQFIIGTPGRIFDLMNRKALSGGGPALPRANIKVLIMDEADQMLEDKFHEQVMCILDLGFPQTTQVALFSATMPPEVVGVAERMLRNPIKILIPPENVTLDGISQYRVDLPNDEWKIEALLDIYSQLNINQAMIYCNKRQRVEWLAENPASGWRIRQLPIRGIDHGDGLTGRGG